MRILVRSRWLRRLTALFVVGTGWLPALTATAQTKVQEELTCIGCHRPKDSVIDPVRYGAGVHGRVDCSACHTSGFTTVPHSATRAAAPDCGECHDFAAQTQAVNRSVHATVADPAFRCTNCHSPHYFVPAARMTVEDAVRTANETCLKCHAKGDTDRERRDARARLAARHRWISHWDLHLRSAPCVACHTPRDQQTVHLILPAAEAVKDCATCHARTSMLATKLYAHLASKERAERGWLNAIIFNNAYVVGATRNRWLDWAMFGLGGVFVAGLTAHGAGRWLCARWRRMP